MSRSKLGKCWLVVVLWFLPTTSALADGGTVQLTQRSGDYQFTVMTDPSPLRVGLIDVSVMIQDTYGKMFRDGRAIVSLRRLDEPSYLIRAEATSIAATNKLLRSAQLELPRGGRWELLVELNEVPVPTSVTTVVHVAERSPRWRAALGWILAPLAPIGLYALGELLAARERPSARPKAVKLEDVCV